MAFQALIFVMSGDPATGPVGIANATVSCSGVTVTTSAIGQANLSVSSIAVGSPATLTISAPGFVTQTQTLTATQYVNSQTYFLAPTGATSQVVVTVTDGTDGIADAAIFINGASGGSTGAEGTAAINLISGSNQLQISAPGFQTYTASISSTNPPDHIVLTAAAGAAQNLTLVSSPPASTLQIAAEGGTLGSNGTYVTQNKYAPGSYTVTLTSGTQTSTTTLTVVAGTSVYQLNPVSVTDNGSGAALQTVSGTGAAAPTSSNPTSPTTSNQAQAAAAIAPGGVISSTAGSVPDYEYVNPTAGFGRYFTATQARMYIGNLFIEELAGVQFVVQANKVPIYGYAADLFDAIGNGKSLVQGQLMVHFISEGYLYTVLNEYKRSTGATATANSSTQQAFQNLMDTQQQLQAANPQTPSIQAQIASIQQQRQQMLAADPTLASTFKRTTLANSTTAVGPNGVYQNVPFDIVLELEGGGRTVTRRIFNCVLTSNEQIYGDNDSPLIDSYGFIGRRLR